MPADRDSSAPAEGKAPQAEGSGPDEVEPAAPEVKATGAVPPAAEGKADTGLLRRAAQGGALLGIGQALATVIGWVTTIVLARLLTPELFGLVGMANVLLGFFGAINDLGLTAALIQRKDLTDAHRDAAFYSSLTMGVVLFIIACASAPALALFYDEPRVTEIVIVAAIPLLMGPFWSTHAALLRRRLQFRTIAEVEVIRTVASGVVSIVLAFMGFGYWAILAGPVARQLIAVVLYGRADKEWRVGRRGTRRHAKELFSFSLYVVGAGAVNYVSANVDYLVVGKLLGPTALGTYTLAYETMTFPLTRISTLFSQVMFPAFATIQTDLPQMRDTYVRISRTLAIISFPILAWVGIAAPELISLVYGEKWAPAIPILRIFCVAGALKSVGTLVGIVYKSRGKASIELWWNIAWLAMLAPGVLIGIRWGVEGVAVAITALTIPGVLFTEWLACHYIDLKFTRLLKVFVLPVAGVAAAVAVGIAFRAPLAHLPIGGMPGLAIKLAALSLCVLVVYAAVLRVLHPGIGAEAKVFLGYFRKKKKA